jgi:cell pole-organizing protein PopZ
MAVRSNGLRGLAISAAASLALLTLTNIAGASLVLSGHENGDQSYKAAATAPQAPQERQADLQQDAQGPKDVSARENAETKPDATAAKDSEPQDNDRKARAERPHREDLGDLAHRKLRGWLHRLRIGGRW